MLNRQLTAAILCLLIFLLIPACSQTPTGKTQEHKFDDAQLQNDTTQFREHTFSNDETIHFQVIDGLVIIEGDMIMGTIEEIEQRINEYEDLLKSGTLEKTSELSAQALGLRTCTFWFIGCLFWDDFGGVWPHATIYYDLASNLAPHQVRDIKGAIQHWVRFTPLRFVQRSTGDRVIFKRGTNHLCASEMGYKGGIQYISLTLGCEISDIIHEIGHTTGLWHEHSRCDRDDHVTIHYENIDTAVYGNLARHSLKKHCADGKDIHTYDYNSIMHYPSHIFAKGGAAVIVPKDPRVKLDKRFSLSRGDSIYGTSYRYKKELPCQVCTDYRPGIIKPGGAWTAKRNIQSSSNRTFALNLYLHGDQGNLKMTLKRRNGDGTYTTLGTATTTNNGAGYGRLSVQVPPAKYGWYEWTIESLASQEISYDIWDELMY